MGKPKTQSTKYNNIIFDTDSSSNSCDSESSTNSEKSSIETNQKEVEKKLTEKVPKKCHLVRKVNVSPLTRNINSSRWPIGQLLKTRSEDSVRTLNLRELTTLKQVVRSVQNLKQITVVNGYYQLPTDTAAAFKRCKEEIDNFYSKKKKNELQDALLNICKKDNFRSLHDILTTNAVINKMNKFIIRRSGKNNGVRK